MVSVSCRTRCCTAWLSSVSSPGPASPAQPSSVYSFNEQSERDLLCTQARTDTGITRSQNEAWSCPPATWLAPAPPVILPTLCAPAQLAPTSGAEPVPCHLRQTLSAPQGILILPIHPEQPSLASASSGRSAQITPRLGILFAHRPFLARVGSSHPQGREEVLECESSHPKPWTDGFQELADDPSTRTLAEKTLRCAFYTGSHGARRGSAPRASRGNVHDLTPSIGSLPFPGWFPL